MVIRSCLFAHYLAELVEIVFSTPVPALGTDHLTFEGGGAGEWEWVGVGDFWSAVIFFVEAWWTGYFLPFSFICRTFFFSQKGSVQVFVKFIYIYIVAIAVIILIWSCKVLKFSKLCSVLTYVLLTSCIAMFSESHSLHPCHMRSL